MNNIDDLFSVNDGLSHYEKIRTNFCRTDSLIEILENNVRTFDEEPIKILYVGIGINYEDSISCSYTPFFLTAVLEKIDINYQLILVEKDRNIIKDVLSRKKIYIGNRDYRFENDKEDNNWNKYLQLTGQEEKIIHKTEKGLIFLDHIPKKRADGFFYIGNTIDEYLKKGFKSAKIPDKFKKRINEKKIILLNENIATVDLSLYADIHFASCTNVLYQLNSKGQEEAISNISKNMCKDGFLILDDNRHGGSPLFPSFNGNYNLEKQKQAGLVFNKYLYNSSTYQISLFRKE